MAPDAEKPTLKAPLKLLYLDTETTGLNPKTCAPVQFSLITPDTQEHNILIRPHPEAEISPEALKINRVTPEELQDPSRLEPVDAYKKMKSIFLTHVNRFDRLDKFYLVGQNVHFDYGFLSALWERCGDQYLGSFIHYQKIDLIALTAAFKLAGKLQVPNMKLATLSEHFKLGEQVHDALDDIRKTKQIFELFLDALKDVQSDSLKPPSAV